MTQHTAGPWEAHWTGDRWEIGNYSANGHVVAYATDAARIRKLDISPGEANARLMAAAPELLESLCDLENILSCKPYDRDEQKLLALARAAIAKAKGAQQS